jgi:adenosylhomocysteine nucleosidase
MTPRPLIVTAMAEEMGPFLERVTEVGDERPAGGGLLRDATVGGVPVLLLESGIGMVNAAVATTAVLTVEDVSVVISAGTAGGIGNVGVGDVVLGSACILAEADARAFGYELGQIPRMPARYPAHPHLVEIVETLALPVVSGLVLSSDTFVTQARAETMLRDFPETRCVDMESAALAQTCYRLGVPFATIRGISDAGDTDAASDFAGHVGLAAERSAAVVIALVVEWVRGVTAR